MEITENIVEDVLINSKIAFEAFNLIKENNVVDMSYLKNKRDRINIIKNNSELNLSDDKCIQISFVNEIIEMNCSILSEEEKQTLYNAVVDRIIYENN